MKAIVLATALAISSLARAQDTQPPADAFDFRARETEHVAALAGDKGAHASAGRITVHVPAGAMSNEELAGLAERLNRGFDGLVSFTHSPRAWQRVPEKVDYYFHADLFISHADPLAGRVFIAFPRLENGQAPVLHEATHVLLFPSREYGAAHPEIFDPSIKGSTWLGEGLPSYVGFSVARQTGIVEGDPLSGSTLDDVDAICAQSLASPVGAEIEPYIGAPGEPAALSSRARRLEVAPGFYACATSFAKFVAERIGVVALVDSLIALDSEAQIAKSAGIGVDALRAAWRKKIDAR